jgi:3-hydroxy-9,10-secoandrosta-1,3,5(10)-triene-9,17-dione monooxygenase reductase component
MPLGAVDGLGVFSAARVCWTRTHFLGEREEREQMSMTQDFKDALASWASGVTVVATKSEGLVYGLTVSSFSSLSLDPPLILVCLNRDNRLASMIGQSGAFSVSILGQKQQEASNHFASPAREPGPEFTGIEGAWTALDQPIVKGASAHLACELDELIEKGDHAIVVGRVVHAAAEENGGPLLYYQRGFRQMAM